MADLFTEFAPVIDFGSTTTPFETERRQHLWLLWPAYAYRILIPVRQRSHFNLFQRIVLKLCRAGVSEATEIAAHCAMSEELVAFIITQLQEMGLLDSGRGPTPRALRLLQDEEACPVMQDAGFVFSDAISGQLWPRLHRGSLPEVDPDFPSSSNGNRPREVRVLRGSPGRPEQVSARIVWPPSPGRALEPTVASVLRAARLHNSRCREWARQSASREGDAREIDLTLIRDVRLVEAHALPVFVMCQVFMPKDLRQRTWLVTDPLGLGVTDLIRKSINQLASDSNGEFIRRLITQITNEAWRIDDGDLEALFEQARENAARRISGLLGSGNISLRQDVLSALEESELCHERIRANRSPKISDLEEYIRQAYIVVEFAFKWMVDLYPDPSLKHRLGKDTESNANLLRKIAVQLGFSYPKQRNALFKADPGQVQAVLEKSNQRQLRGTLPAVILAAREASGHPLAQLAGHLPSSLEFIVDLDSRRNNAAHNGKDVPIKAEIESIRSGLISLMKALSGANQPTTLLDQSMSLDWSMTLPLKLRAKAEMLTARVEDIDHYPELKIRTIELYYAALVFRALLPERELQSDFPKPAAEFVIRASILLEAIGSLLLERSPASKINPSTFYKESRDRCSARIVQAASACGFASGRHGKFPDSLVKVAPRRICSAIQNKSGTLSAIYGLCLLNAADHASHVFKEMAKLVPDLLVIVGDVVDARGHGDDIRVSPRRQQKIEADVIKVLKASLEVLA